MLKTKLAIFVSGGGSNAQKIVKHFENNPFHKIALIVTNNKYSGVINHSIFENIPIKIISNSNLKKEKHLLNILIAHEINFIVLAGFLKRIPSEIVQHYNRRILNIHPALLPKYGGLGMYGMNVHEAVFANKDHISGMTIHWVNEQYDEGQIVFQATCDIENKKSAEAVAKSVLNLEHQYYPRIIQQCLDSI